MLHRAARVLAATAPLAAATVALPLVLAEPAAAQLPPLVRDCAVLPEFCALVDELEATVETVLEPLDPLDPLAPVTEPVTEPVLGTVEDLADSLGVASPVPTTPTAAEPKASGAPAAAPAAGQTPAATKPTPVVSSAATRPGSTVGLVGRETSRYRAMYTAPTPVPSAAAPVATMPIEQRTAQAVLDVALPSFEPIPRDAPSILVPGLIAAIMAMAVAEGLRRAHLAGHRIWI